MFFFSSRRRHTRWPRDWSSDVCSSDLGGAGRGCPGQRGATDRPADHRARAGGGQAAPAERVPGEVGRASCRERVERWEGGEAGEIKGEKIGADDNEEMLHGREESHKIV